MTWFKNKSTIEENTGTQGNHNSVKSWYFKKTKDGIISQFVMKIPVTSVKETEFGMILLPSQNFPIVSSEEWCTGFIRMNGKPYPYQMIRVDEFDNKVAESDMTIAFSFCKLKNCGIFLIDVRIENSSITEKVKQKFRHAPPVSMPILEWIVSLTDSYSLEMIQEVLASPILNIIVANSKGAQTTIFDNYGGKKDCMGPHAHHERTFNFDGEMNIVLNAELKALIDHHNSIPSSIRDFKIANQELSQLLPFDKDPIPAI
jgi:hypothetical protein